MRLTRDNAALVAGEAGSNFIEQATVDLVDDLQVARQHQLEPRHRPFLERFGQQRVVGVGQSLLRDVPGLVPTEVRFVEQNPHQLGDRQGRMSIVELDGHFLREVRSNRSCCAGNAGPDRPASRPPGNTPARSAGPAPCWWSRPDTAPGSGIRRRGSRPARRRNRRC